MGINATEILNDVLKVHIINDDISYVNKRTEYGVRFIVGQENPVGERVTRLDGVMKFGGDTGLIHNVGKDNINVFNSFDHIPAFKAWDEIVNGNHLRMYAKHYMLYERVEDGGTTYDYYWISLTKHPNYFLPHVYVDNYGNDRDVFGIGKYKASLDENGILRSVSGKMPSVSSSGANHLNGARLNDGLGANSKWIISDIHEKGWFNFRQLIRFATKNIQSVLVGVTNLSYTTTHATLGSQTNSNSFVLPTSQANEYVVGQIISGGSSQGSNSVFAYRELLSKEDNFPNSGETTLTFEGEPANIPSGTIIGSRAWKTGKTDTVVATDGYLTANNGKYPIKIDGIENPFGDIWENVAGVKVNDHKVYVSKDTRKYNWSANTTDYLEVSYELPQSNGYAKEMGYDQNFPLVNMTSETGATSSTYYSDYFYQNTGWRTVLLGGRWNIGAASGLWYWNANDSLGHAYLDIGSRLSYRP